MTETDKQLCPSSRCQPGAGLLGVRQEDGSIAIFPTPLPIDEAFIQKAGEDGSKPEEKFRFVNKCIEGGCVQWTGERCGVADRMMESVYQIQLPIAANSVPDCAIRRQCRWYSQHGSDACTYCQYVVTEITAEEVEQYAEHINEASWEEISGWKMEE